MVTEYTVRDIVNAMRENGYTQHFDELFEFDYNGEVIKACALGQALINLKAVGPGLGYSFDDKYEVVRQDILSTITRLNDKEKWPLNKIANFVDHVYFNDGNIVVFKEREVAEYLRTGAVTYDG